MLPVPLWHHYWLITTLRSLLIVVKSEQDFCSVLSSSISASKKIKYRSIRQV